MPLNSNKTFIENQKKFKLALHDRNGIFDTSL